MAGRTEDSEQIAVIGYCDAVGIPVVHIPNEGKRSYRYGAQLKAMGLRRGFPDLFIPQARLGYYGLFIEMKAGRGRLSDHQREWLHRLNEYGYAVAVCYGADEAITKIRRYMDGKQKDDTCD